MKKLFILALFVLGTTNSSLFGMVQEIVLNEIYVVTPFDDPGDNIGEERPDPNQITASTNGRRISVRTNNDLPAYVEVIDQETGDVVMEESFVNETQATLHHPGFYILRIYLGNTIVAGEFEIE